MKILLAFAVSCALVLRWVKRRWAVIAVTGTSMTPTFQEGDRVLARQRPKRIAVGDVIVLEEPGAGPGRWIVKRVAAVAGDPVPGEAAGVVAAGELVPPRHVVVLGDNRAHSADSRHYGFLAAHRVYGRALRRL